MSKDALGDFGRPFPPGRETGLKVSLWPTALIGIVVIKTVLAMGVTPGSFLLSYSGVSYFLLLSLAACFAVRNGIQNIAGASLFWVFLALAYGSWALDQGIILYYELGRHVEAPNSSIADPLPQAIQNDIEFSVFIVFLGFPLWLFRFLIPVRSGRQRLCSAI
jgi:hypothetical protein